MPARLGLILIAAFLLLSCGRASSRESTTQSSARIGPPTFQTEPRYAVEDAEHGAVLCTWMIVVEMKATSEKCHASESPAIDAALADTLSDIHRFVAANSPTTVSEIQAQATQRIAQAKTEDICSGDGEQMYQAIRARGAPALRQSTARMLAVPRPPVMNPCL